MSPARKISGRAQKSIVPGGEQPERTIFRQRLAFFSIIMVLLPISYMIDNLIRGWLILASVFCVCGGIAGVAVLVSRDVSLGRRIGVLAGVLTGLGILLFVIGQ